MSKDNGVGTWMVGQVAEEESNLRPRVFSGDLSLANQATANQGGFQGQHHATAVKYSATDSTPLSPPRLIAVSIRELRVRVVDLSATHACCPSFRPSHERGGQSSVQEHSTP
jgi:hypothetical protein